LCHPSDLLVVKFAGVVRFPELRNVATQRSLRLIREVEPEQLLSRAELLEPVLQPRDRDGSDDRAVDASQPAEGDPGEDPNQNATVMLASYGSVDALLTADAESGVTLPLRPPPVEILKVAHHGSADEGLARLLSLLRPEIAVISCGVGNDYGHPAPSTIAALEAAPGLALYRTDNDGRVTIESDGRRLAVTTER
jgi:beta-lactamase superfamily II metal-dependent hydrolase